jgi:LmbE family N-acetylglucosaminyl deacetylase
MNAESKLRVLVIGAHPDDCEFKAGGVATKYAALGHTVRFVSMTNGDAGHHEIGGVQLARRRKAEAEEAARVIGIESQVLDHHDGQLEASIVNRKTTIRLIRGFEPDLILTHRPNDYHPDHRNTSTLVQDASYLVTVPNICTDTRPLADSPVIAYLSDQFQKPYPFKPEVVVTIDECIEQKLDMLHRHTSQVYEWLAWHDGVLAEVPLGLERRREWLRARMITPFDTLVAEKYRDTLVRWYGRRKGKAIRHAEAFELCEYGRQPNEEELRRLFPFFD